MAASWPPADHRGANLKKMMTVEQLFAAPKNVRKTEARLERAKLTNGCGAGAGGGDGDGEGEEIRGADAPYRVAEAPFSQEVE